MLLCIVMTCLGILLGESYALRVLLFSLFRVSLAQDFNKIFNMLNFDSKQAGWVSLKKLVWIILFIFRCQCFSNKEKLNKNQLTFFFLILFCRQVCSERFCLDGPITFAQRGA